MDAAALTRTAVAGATLASGLAWFVTPAHPLVAAALGLTSVIVTLHGLGRAVGVALDDRAAPAPLAIAWGLAVWLTLGGVLAATVGFPLGAQRVVGALGALASAAWLLTRPPWRPQRPSFGGDAVAFALTVSLIALHALGAAATWSGSFADADGHLIGPLARLASTGVLGDPIGLPRASGLGGNVVAHALVAPLGDLHAAHAIDRGLGLGLTVALATLLAPRSRTTAALGLTVALLASSVPEFPGELAPRWLVVALILAIAVTLDRRPGPRAPLGAALVGGAAATILHGGLGLALATAIVAVADGPRHTRGRRALLAIALGLGPALAYVVAARRSAPADLSALAVPPGLAVRLVAAALAGVVVDAFGQLALRPGPRQSTARALRAIAVAIAAALWLSPTAAAMWLQLQPLGLATLLIIIVPLLAAPTPDRVVPAALVGAVALAFALAISRFPLGRPPTPWGQRLGQLVTAMATRDRERLAPADDPETATYAAGVAAIPPGARVGAWVDRPELLDYRRHRILDLRTPAAARCVGIPMARRRRLDRIACRRLGRQLAALRLDYLLVSDAAFEPTRATAIPPALCPFCLDPLAARLANGVREPAPPGLRIVRVPRH